MRAEFLLAGRLQAWLRPAPPPPLWLFVHVPKTAGSSLATDLAEMLPPYRSIHIDHADRSRSGPERFELETTRFIAEWPDARPRFASGHVQWRQVARIIEALPETRLFTMLREPVARLVSDYLYQRSPMHPLAEEVKAKVPDFDAFLDLRGQSNRQSRHLAPKRLVDAGDPAPVIAHLRARYAFVGVQERYELCFRALTHMLGGQRRPAARKRVNDGAAEEKARVLARLEAPEVKERVARLNALDMAVYADISAAWSRIARPLERRLDELGSGSP